nr:hypothetical protein [Cryobacterium cryoconiti]
MNLVEAHCAHNWLEQKNMLGNARGQERLGSLVEEACARAVAYEDEAGDAFRRSAVEP